MIAPAERYEVLVDFSDGRPVDLVTATDAHRGMGPGMMMQMGRPRTPRGGIESVMRFSPESELRVTVTRLPRDLVKLPAPTSSRPWNGAPSC
jgi:FtsP/CotA-like multicopper oxidase with cupredoxin domain